MVTQGLGVPGPGGGSLHSWRIDVLISSEALTEVDSDQLGRQRRTLEPGFDSFAVVYVLRRPDIVATRHITTR